MEVWKIGDSNPAPNFHIICKPNNWFKTVKLSINSAGLSDIQNLQLKFWDKFKEYCETNKIALNLRKTSPQHWYDMSFGRSDCHIALTLNSQKKEIACEVYIPNAKETFLEFKKNEQELENEIGKLQWMELPAKKASRVKLSVKADFKFNTHKSKNKPKVTLWLISRICDSTSLPHQQYAAPQKINPYLK